MLNIFNKFLGVIVFLLMTVTMLAQPKDNSPYSRLGIGDFANQQFAASTSMGRLSAAWNDPFHANIENPASLAYLRSTAFEIGLNADYTTLESAGNSTGIWSGNLSYISLSFPIRNSINKALERDESDFDWGMGISLMPYTTVGYDIRITDYQPEIDTTVNIFRGLGGTYKLMWGNGVRYKNLAAGINIGSLFGKITRTSQTSFVELDQSYDNIFEDEISFRGFVWNAGLQYKQPLSKNKNGTVQKSLTFGAYGSSSTSFETNTSQFYRAVHVSNANAIDVDTVSFDDEKIAEGKLPANFTIGLMYQDLNKLRLGVEYRLGNWEDFRLDVRDDVATLENISMFSFGVEYIPDVTSYNSYAKRIYYRAGLHYGTDPRGNNGDLTTAAVSFGMGLPITLPRQGISFVDWAIEIGQFGKSDPNALRETYARMTLGFTLNDNTWFFKRRFN